MHAKFSRRRIRCLLLLVLGTAAWGDIVDVTTITDENNGSLNPGLGTGTSLREAVLHAPEGSRIFFFKNGLNNGQTFTLTAGEIVIGKNLEIDGSALGLGINVSGNNASRVFSVSASKTVTLTGVDIYIGQVTGNGGAILNAGNLTLEDCKLSGNNAGGDGGVIANTGTLALHHCELFENQAGDGGGAIENSGTLNLFSCTFFDNSAAVGGGAIEHASGVLSATNCTFSGNIADFGGAIDGDGSSTIRLYSCTVTGNHANDDGGGLEESGGTLLLENTIIAGNVAVDLGPDIRASGINTQAGVNLLSSTAGLGGSFSGIVANPNLAGLAYSGALTRTMMPLPGSPAIGAGGVSTLRMDQRGEPRAVGAPVDIGSVEIQEVNYFTTAALTTPGLVGSYVNQSLAAVTAPADWRVTQAISGTRTDATLAFTTGNWGSRAAVGVTGGSDADWVNFSVQWDGFLQVTQPGDRVATASDDGSRMWIDLDHDGIFEADELSDNGWGKVQGTRIADRSVALPAGVHPIRIQYYEIGGQNEFHLARTRWVPQQFVPVAGNPQQVVRAIVLNFEPRIPGMGNKRLWEALGWNDPRRLAAQFEADIEFMTGGAIDVQIVESRHFEEFPLFGDGFRFSPDEYAQNRLIGNFGYFTRPVGFDLDHVVRTQGLEALVNAGQIDEIWVFGDHFLLFGGYALGEAWMAGPGSFFINGPSYPEIAFNRAIAGYGFNYERGVAEMVHNLSHRTENHGQRAFGFWNLASPVTAFDKFSANGFGSPGQTPGVGTCHHPANADDEYDYNDVRVVPSAAFDFPGYPALTGATTLVSRDTWALGPVPDYQRDYLNFYFGMVPRNAGTAADGRQANWFKYIWDFNSYEAGTGLPRNEDAFAAGATIRDAGGTMHDFTVRYYDVTGINVATLGNGDVQVTGPNGFSQAATLVSSGVEVPTTGGTARTVTYRINALGGTWDAADTGTYRVNMLASQVQDTSSNAVPAGDIGGFQVMIEDPSAIPVAQMLAGGTASVTHTALDIGTISNLFDGKTSTLIRTPNIDPAVVTLTFTSAQTFHAFRTYFDEAFDDPAYQWKIETANTQADLDGQTGSWQQAVALTGTPSDAYSSVTLPAPIIAKLARLTATRLTGDDYVHINEWHLIGPVVSDSTAPAASGSSANVHGAGGTKHFITVDYSDDVAIDVASLGNGDLLITGPGGFSGSAFFYDVDNHVDGSPREVTYWFIPPGGTWDSGDSGSYLYTLQPQQVADTTGNTHGVAQVLGTFTMFIDSDEDGMPDDYELAHGFNPDEIEDALSDSDDDGWINLDEFRAGTGPRDPTSHFAVVEVLAGATEVTLSWRSAPGRRYRIETSPDLSAWTFIESGGVPVLVNAAAVEDVTSYTIPIAPPAGRGFFRVELFSW